MTARAASAERRPSEPDDWPIPATRAAYAAFLEIPTRWMDNDVYGHVNNVTYYAYFDTVVNEHLVRAGGLDVERSPAIGVVVETACRFHKALAFPDVLDAGMRVVALGRSSVRYEIALFRQGDDDAAASGRFVHVWVDRMSVTPAELPARIREALQPLVVA